MRFHHGDHVRIADDLGRGMSHFPGAGEEAIVIGSYGDQYGGNDHHAYTLHVRGHGENSWYQANQLTLIARERISLLEQWEAEAEAESAQKGDLDWIFAHGDEVLAGAHGATVATLAGCLGITNLWGSRGEGLTYYMNAHAVLSRAEPFLLSGNKGGWLALCTAIIANATRK